MIYNKNMINALAQKLLNRPSDANKYDFGHLLIIGGSEGMSGAPVLAGYGALRTGAGLVTIAAPKSQNKIIASQNPDLLTLVLPETTEKSLEITAYSEIKNYIIKRKVNALAIGPGLSKNRNALLLVEKILLNINLPIVLDADALSCLNGHLLKNRLTECLIITPHLGEFSRLVKIPLEQIARQREILVKDYAKKNKVFVVLKGHQSIIAHPDGRIHRNKTGNPGMAVGGSGDVLTGIIGSLIVQSYLPAKAVEFGVHLHGLAGDLAEKEKTQPGLIASDLIDYLPKALAEIEQKV
jgi:hydroxyethylthiazole kinase-like uncharacterized protein yjeF